MKRATFYVCVGYVAFMLLVGLSLHFCAPARAQEGQLVATINPQDYGIAEPVMQLWYRGETSNPPADRILLYVLKEPAPSLVVHAHYGAIQDNGKILVYVPELDDFFQKAEGVWICTTGERVSLFGVAILEAIASDVLMRLGGRVSA